MIEISGLQPVAQTTQWGTDRSSLYGGAVLHLESEKNGRLALRVLVQTGFLGIFEGGAGSNCLLQLSQANVNDVLQMLVDFANGSLS